jgi:lysozyme
MSSGNTKTYTLAGALAALAISGSATYFIVGNEGIGPVVDERTGLISNEGKKAFLDFALSSEHFTTLAYQDVGGVWTICYGTTIYPDGRRVKQGDTATRDECVKYIEHHLETRVDPELLRCTKKSVRVTLGEATAYRDHLYNTGKWCGTTLLKVVNSSNGEDCLGIVHELERWTRVEGKIDKGLVGRVIRRARLTRCLAAEYGGEK